MKSYTLAILLSLYGSLSAAQISQEARSRYEIWIQSLSAADLAFEVSKTTGLASWYCGSDIVKQIYADIQSGKKPETTVSKSKECMTQSDYFEIAAGQIYKLGKGLMASNGVIDTPTSIYNFSIQIPQINKSSLVEQEGDGFCMETAAEMFNSWIETEKLDSSFTELKSNSTLQCQVDRRGNEKSSKLSCDHWLVTSHLNFATGEVLLVTGETKRLTAEEKERLKHPPGVRANLDDKVKHLNDYLDAGVHIIGVLTTKVGATTGTFEIRGISGREWHQRYTGADGGPRKNTADMQALCSIKTKIDLNVSQISLEGLNKYMRTFLSLLVVSMATTNAFAGSRILSCWTIDDNYNRTQRLNLELRESSQAEIDSCRNDKCGTKAEDYLVSEEKIAFKTPRYAVKVAVRADYTLVSMQVFDILKGIGFNQYDGLRIEEGKSYEIFVQQREKTISSQLIGCRVEKKQTF